MLIGIAVGFDQFQQFDLIHGLIKEVFVAGHHFEASEFLSQQILNSQHFSEDPAAQCCLNLISSCQYVSWDNLFFGRSEIFIASSLSIVNDFDLHGVVYDPIIFKRISFVVWCWELYTWVKFSSCFLFILFWVSTFQRFLLGIFFDCTPWVIQFLCKLSTPSHKFAFFEWILMISQVRVINVLVLVGCFFF